MSSAAHRNTSPDVNAVSCFKRGRNLITLLEKPHTGVERRCLLILAFRLSHRCHHQTLVSEAIWALPPTHLPAEGHRVPSGVPGNKSRAVAPANLQSHRMIRIHETSVLLSLQILGCIGVIEKRDNIWCPIPFWSSFLRHLIVFRETPKPCLLH